MPRLGDSVSRTKFIQLGHFSQLVRFNGLTKLTQLSKLTKPVVLLLLLAVSSHAADPTTQPLLHESDLTFVGAFKVPGLALPNTFDYSNGISAGNVYDDPVHGKSLFITGYLSAGYVSEQASVGQVGIPASIKDPYVVGMNGLTTATLIQGLTDPSNGVSGQALSGNGSTALVVYGGKLIGTENVAYDGDCSQSKSAWVAPLNFAQKAQATGPYAFNAGVGPRWLGGGYMAMIPPEWQSLLGGKVVSGNGPWSIISCGSPGPTLFVIDADGLVAQPPTSTPIASTPLVYYKCLPGFGTCTGTLGAWNSNDPNQTVNAKKVPSVTITDAHGRGSFTIPYEDNAMKVNGVLFADQTRSVLFFGKKGLGRHCYGEGTNTQSLDGQPVPGSPGVEYCYDPDAVGSKGDHSYPYTQFVWAYDVNDLLAAKNGSKNPMDVVPYTGWSFKTFNDGDGGAPAGAVWDSATRMLYIVASCTGGGNCDPLVNVYHVAGGSASAGSACDLNIDGSTNVSDVQVCANQAIGAATCSMGDINKDSVCNVVDVQRVVNAALGGQCVTQ
jgi:hypothetical protein